MYVFVCFYIHLLNQKLELVAVCFIEQLLYGHQYSVSKLTKMEKVTGLSVRLNRFKVLQAA